MISLFLSIGMGLLIYDISKNVILSVIEAILSFIPISEIVIKVVQNVLGKILKPKLIPKMDLSKGIDKENTSMVVIPTIIESRKKGRRTCRKVGSILSCKQI